MPETRLISEPTIFGVVDVGPVGFESRIVLAANATTDLIAPVVDNFSPANGTAIDGTDPIFFDVTDNGGLFTRIIVAVDQPSSTETIHDGDDFLPPYKALSTRITIDGGFQYKVRRDGGWLGTVDIRAYAIDSAGNENA